VPRWQHPTEQENAIGHRGRNRKTECGWKHGDRGAAGSGRAERDDGNREAQAEGRERDPDQDQENRRTARSPTKAKARPVVPKSNAKTKPKN